MSPLWGLLLSCIGCSSQARRETEPVVCVCVHTHRCFLTYSRVMSRSTPHEGLVRGPRPSSVILGTLPNHSELSAYLQTGDNNSTYLTGLLGGVNEKMLKTP